MSHTYLNFPAAPNLPLAPRQWDAQYQDQFANVLRLYFNQLSRLLQQLSDTQGGYHLSFPYGAFHQDGQTSLSIGITNVSTTPINVASTSGFPSSGYILIESEIIQYTATTATTFTGTITRGALGTSQSAHTAGLAITEVQGTGSGATIGTVLFNNTDYSSGVYASQDYTKVFFDKPGVYNLQLSLQLLNYTTSDDNVTLWLRQNGSDVAATAGVVTAPSKHGSVPGASIAAWNYLLEVKGGDYVGLYWTTDSGNTVIGTYPSGTSPAHPSSPGVIFTATFVSAPTA